MISRQFLPSIASLCLAASCLGQPANDTCETAQQISAGVTHYSIAGATTEGGGCATVVGDVWFRFVASETGTMRVANCVLDDMATMLSVFDTCGGTQLACSSGNCGTGQTEVLFQAQAGTAYSICVGTRDGLFPNGKIVVRPFKCPPYEVPECLTFSTCPGTGAGAVFQAGCVEDDHAVPGAALAAVCTGGRDFHVAASGQPFCHTITGLPGNIVGAALEIGLKAGTAGAPCDDTISLQVSGTGNFLWSKRIGTGGPDLSCFGDSGILTTAWDAGDRRTICLNLAQLPTADLTMTSLITALNASRRLDIHVADDTEVEYVRLWLDICDLPDPDCFAHAICPSASEARYEAGLNEDDAPAPGIQLASLRPNQRDFGESAVNAGLSHTFGGLSPNIFSAALQIKLRAASTDATCNDALSLQVSGTGGGFAWFRRIGTGGCDAFVGLVGTPWDHDAEATICLNLEQLPNADGTVTNLLPLMRAMGRLDLHVQDDTSVEWVRLWVDMCPPCASGGCDVACMAPWGSSMCRNGSFVDITVTVCNVDSGTGTFLIDCHPDGGAGCTGPSPYTFEYPNGTLITIDGVGCVTVPVRIHRPPGLDVGERGCYEVRATNVDSGDTATSSGSVLVSPRWCPVPCCERYVEIAAMTTEIVHFRILGDIEDESDLDLQIFARPGGGLPGTSPVSLGGTPPGSILSGTFTFQPGDVFEFTVETAFTECDPSRFHEVVLLTDLNDDGTIAPDEVLDTVVIRCVPALCPCDWNHSGAVDSADFFDFLGSFFSGSADFNEDGISDSADFFDYLACFFNPPPACG